MKKLSWILVFLLIGVVIWIQVHPPKPLSVEIKRDTVIIVETVRDTILKPVKEYICRVDTVNLPILIDSSNCEVEEDSISILIPITSKEYKTNQYRALISGYHPNLDFIETYNTMQTITIAPKRKRWGLSLQVGYGIYKGGKGLYLGGGVSYNLFMW